MNKLVHMQIAPSHVLAAERSTHLSKSVDELSFRSASRNDLSLVQVCSILVLPQRPAEPSVKERGVMRYMNC